MPTPFNPLTDTVAPSASYDPTAGMPEVQKTSYLASTAQPTATYNPSTGMNEYPTGATPAPTGITRAQAAQDRDASLAYYDRIFNEERARLTQADAEEKAILGVRLTKRGAVGGVGQGSEEMGAATPFQTTGNRKITDFTSQRVGEAQTRAMEGRNAATQNFQNVLLKMDELDIAKKAEARAQATFDQAGIDKAKNDAKTAAEGLISTFTAGGGTFEAMQKDTENYAKLLKVYGNETSVRGAYNIATLLADKDLQWKEVYRADESGNAILHRYAVGTDGTLKTQDLKLGIPYAEVSAGNAKTIDGHIYAQQADGSYKRLDPVTDEEKQKLALVEAQIQAAKASAEASRASAAENRANAAKIAGETVGTPESKAKAKDQITLVKNSLEKAKALAGASGRSGARKLTENFLVGSTDYTNLVAETNTLRTNVLTMATDPAIKKFFGPQMSNADVQLMTSAGTTLNPELQSPEKMKSELARLEELVGRMEKAVTSEGNSAAAGTIVESGGVKYRVGDDGETLTPIE